MGNTQYEDNDEIEIDLLELFFELKKKFLLNSAGYCGRRSCFRPVQQADSRSKILLHSDDVRALQGDDADIFS